MNEACSISIQKNLMGRKGGGLEPKGPGGPKDFETSPGREGPYPAKVATQRANSGLWPIHVPMAPRTPYDNQFGTRKRRLTRVSREARAGFCAQAYDTISPRGQEDLIHWEETLAEVQSALSEQQVGGP